MADVKKIATREAYGSALAEFGKDYDFVVLDADLSKSTKTDTFKKSFPDRFINLCTKEGIPLWNVRNINNNITASTTVQGYLSIHTVARKSGMRVISTDKVGLKYEKTAVGDKYVYENMIAQMLRASGKELYYHIIPTQDGKKYYETDFLISDDYKISPIEVKSSGYKTHASLDVFRQKYSQRISNSFLVYSKDFQKGDNELMTNIDGLIYTKDLAWEKGILYLPVYMTMFL